MNLNQLLNEDENLLLELGDAPHPWEWTRAPHGIYKSGEATFNVGNNIFNVQLFYRSDVDRTEIFWDKNNQFSGSDDENSPVRIIFTIMDIVKSYVSDVRPKYITFEAKRGPGRDGRNKLASLYSSIVKRFAVKMGYSSESEGDRYNTIFTLTRRDKKLRLDQ